jgi:hypothetical protein
VSRFIYCYSECCYAFVTLHVVVRRIRPRLPMVVGENSKKKVLRNWPVEVRTGNGRTDLGSLGLIINRNGHNIFVRFCVVSSKNIWPKTILIDRDVESSNGTWWNVSSYQLSSWKAHTSMKFVKFIKIYEGRQRMLLVVLPVQGYTSCGQKPFGRQALVQ